ncbi:Protein SUPPRESSOR OF K(+) TRANSPORT GROWTH DEFECT 1 [Striga hermonthica]|uniref:Protein SUPPRESSOR OF K(+) TRANSPORT GROWTH DEFECT 1 n=1 Tax=Striga hermonthica TaxID=68872 RepID=A0A9N7REE4_STRHE|nr:Protein SUPPRESSOR OF K(+) TRANSPORT GROWTH DEFECT 1 [Striga hermonthica]
MYSNFKEQAIEYVRQAVAEDNAGNYAKAFPLYMNALEYFKTHLKYEKNPKIKEAITQKFTEYLRRAEEIRAVLDEGGSGPTSNGDAAVATRPKTKPKDGNDGEDGDKEKLRSGLNSAIVREKPNVKWNDVAGLESAKQALQEAVILPVKFPQFFTGKRRPWRAFLLYGPPGTGKSYLAKAVATEADSTFFSVSSSDLVSKWMGESEKLVSNLFQMARESSPAIIFIDEIDSLCGQRGEGNESEASRRIKTELLVQMQGVGHNDDKVLVLAATNTPYALDQAIRRRFDKRIYIPLPDQKARQHMFKVHLGDTPHNLNESDFEALARKTEGFSGSDISVCVKDVLFEPVRKTQDAMFFTKTSNGLWMPCGPKQPGAVQITMQELASQGLAAKIIPPPISRMDFDKVLARQRPTVSKSDLDVHERFTKEFGEEENDQHTRQAYIYNLSNSPKEQSARLFYQRAHVLSAQITNLGQMNYIYSLHPTRRKKKRCLCKARQGKARQGFRPSNLSKMKVIAAYLLAVLGGNTTPSADDVKAILGSVGAEAEDEKIELLLSQVKGKDITELIASGREKLASVPSGGGAVAVATPAGGAGGDAPAAAETKKEEKVEEKEESDDDLGFSLFD